MITRDVLNHLGEKIGEMSFADITLESEISAKLAVYAMPPAVKTPLEIVREKAKKMTRFNIEIKEEVIAENMLLGISAIPNGRNLCDVALGPAFDEIRNCKYPEALALLYALKADSSKHFDVIITPERVQSFIDKIIGFLGAL